jgi:hypothetical protein
MEIKLKPTTFPMKYQKGTYRRVADHIIMYIRSDNRNITMDNVRSYLPVGIEATDKITIRHVKSRSMYVIKAQVVGWTKYVTFNV